MARAGDPEAPAVRTDGSRAHPANHATRNATSATIIESRLFKLPYCRIRNLADAGVARQQTAGRYLHALSEAGILREIPSGREKLYLNHRLLRVLCDGADDWEPFNVPST